MPAVKKRPKISDLKAERKAKRSQAEALLNKTESENRDMSDEEDTEYNDLMKSVESLSKRIDRLESQGA